ncbi:MAG: hypothetical protein K2X66_04455 [Cyanobacteria bacterium]|nr:hypothetical protein [Cyanobacteriota bacterium]
MTLKANSYPLFHYTRILKRDSNPTRNNPQEEKFKQEQAKKRTSPPLTTPQNKPPETYQPQGLQTILDQMQTDMKTSGEVPEANIQQIMGQLKTDLQSADHLTPLNPDLLGLPRQSFLA